MKNKIQSKIRILVIEDNNKKFEDIEKRFDTLNGSQTAVKFLLTRSKGVISSVLAYDKNFFDIVILDLMLPVGEGNGEDNEGCCIENAVDVYDHIKSSPSGSPFLIVGLTALKKDEYQEHFSDDPILSIESYKGTGWFNSIIEKIDFVVRGKTAFGSFLDNNHSIDVIVLTARSKNEFKPIVDDVEWVDDISYPHPRIQGRSNAFGRITHSDGSRLEIGIVCLGEMGLSIAASYTTQLMHMFRPRYFAMLGMCCGFKESDLEKTAKLGDVIVARQTANWDEGKYSDSEIKLDPMFHHRAIERSPENSTTEEIKQILEDVGDEIESELKSLYESEKYASCHSEIEGFDTSAKLHFELLLSGSSVVNSASKVEQIKKRFSSAVGLEMEAHSVYSAQNCLLGLKPKTLVLKGVADYGDGSKTKSIQSMASVASWRTFLKILETF